MVNRSPSLPSLYFFKGFEAAARHLSFTKAAEELFVTQSAVSRQIQALEQRLGVALFLRRNRGLALTEAGEQMWRAVDSALRTLHQAVEQVSPGATPKMVTVTSSMAFSSLWLIPRLSGFRRLHPDVDVRISANNQVLDIDRERIDLAIRYCPSRAAPAGSVRLFGEEILPVCSPALLRDRSRPLKSPQDLRHHVLLHFDEPHRPTPWLTWNVWLETAGVPDLEPADSLRFNHYDQTIGAALGGQGVALGRRPLVKKLLADGALVAPFPLGSVTDRAYFIVRTPATSGRPEVARFVEWLIAEAAVTTAKEGDTGNARRKPPPKK
jgi:LysR family glycine cleavage system transcriptional activator